MRLSPLTHIRRGILKKVSQLVRITILSLFTTDVAVSVAFSGERLFLSNYYKLSNRINLLQYSSLRKMLINRISRKIFGDIIFRV